MAQTNVIRKNKLSKKRKGLTLKQQRSALGYLFISPFLIGFLLLFLTPLIQSLLYSFSNLTVTATGYTLDSVGWSNYNRALFVEPEFIPALLTTIVQLISKVPVVLIFSFFAAVLLNQKFKGRGFARSVFFLPVILTSGIILSIESSDLMLSSAQQVAEDEMSRSSNQMMQFLQFRQLLYSINLPVPIINFIVLAVDQIYDIVIASGVQILIFLAGLQSIPRSLYEASTIDGATPWENFWKITFPMASPLIIVNTVYTVINTFTSPDNEMMSTIHRTIFSHSHFGFGSAMAWIYFLSVAIILMLSSIVLIKLVSKYQH
ncbi:carbohydrate ABC transporter permease [Alkalihalobacillus trypoxylicola]|uniref:ABC transporter permease n=1 Tax=Alkalihalobacillus trypoxylicola TaxID=519424 RepID=A0A162FCE9_9BACI|nr:sugar ABC transporter permease [Alkalihalobacillus trypoxylicola]KYG35280.1 ABC transporter permease [Alkalihalobacillus trypoxylicola]